VLYIFIQCVARRSCSPVDTSYESIAYVSGATQYKLLSHSRIKFIDSLWTNFDSIIPQRRSRLPSGLRYTLSSLVRRPGSWVGIPLRAWMFDVCAFFCVCVVLCLGRGFATSWSPVQGVLPTVNDQETEKSSICAKSGSKEEEKDSTGILIQANSYFHCLTHSPVVWNLILNTSVEATAGIVSVENQLESVAAGRVYKTRPVSWGDSQLREYSIAHMWIHPLPLETGFII
jgi:hypothetical protein